MMHSAGKFSEFLKKFNSYHKEPFLLFVFFQSKSINVFLKYLEVIKATGIKCLRVLVCQALALTWTEFMLEEIFKRFFSC